jgi:hypothetical protein
MPSYAVWLAAKWRHLPPCAACIVTPPTAGSIPRTTTTPRKIRAASQRSPAVQGCFGTQHSRGALLLLPAPPLRPGRHKPACTLKITLLAPPPSAGLRDRRLNEKT